MSGGYEGPEPLDAAIAPTTPTKRVSGPPWPGEGPWLRPLLPQRLVMAVIATLTGIVAGLSAPAMAQHGSTPQLGMPGFARGFEGFFDDNGHRTMDDENARPATLQPARPEWSCKLFHEMATFERTEGPITVNNVSLRSDTGFLSGLPYAELSFSLVNRSSEPRYPTIQFIVYDTQSPLPALAFSAEPLMSLIEAQITEQVTASVNMRPGELESLRRFCVRIDG